MMENKKLKQGLLIGAGAGAGFLIGFVFFRLIELILLITALASIYYIMKKGERK